MTFGGSQMFKPTTAVFAAFVFTVPLSAAPLESDAIYTSDWTKEHAQALANDASMLIRRAGYRCDTVSSISKWLFSVGFDVNCNGHRYQYEIEDRGGDWRAKLK